MVVRDIGHSGRGELVLGLMPKWRGGRGRNTYDRRTSHSLTILTVSTSA